MAMPFSLTLPASPTGTGGGKDDKRRVLAATAPILLPDWSPQDVLGTGPSKTNHGAGVARHLQRNVKRSGMNGAVLRDGRDGRRFATHASAGERAAEAGPAGAEAKRTPEARGRRRRDARSPRDDVGKSKDARSN